MNMNLHGKFVRGIFAIAFAILFTSMRYQGIPKTSEYDTTFVVSVAVMGVVIYLVDKFMLDRSRKRIGSSKVG